MNYFHVYNSCIWPLRSIPSFDSHTEKGVAICMSKCITTRWKFCSTASWSNWN